VKKESKPKGFIFGEETTNVRVPLGLKEAVKVLRAYYGLALMGKKSQESACIAAAEQLAKHLKLKA
jgi:hypothetical protein